MTDMKKISFDTLPEAISELLERIERIEQLLGNKKGSIKAKSTQVKKSKRKRLPPGQLTVKEAGKLLNISLVTLYSYVKNNKIPFEKQGRRLVFSQAELEKWIKERGERDASIPQGSLTISEAEKALKVPSSTLYYTIKTRKIPAVYKKGNQLFYSKKELVKALNKKNKKTSKRRASRKPKPAPEETPGTEQA